MVTVASVD